MELPPMEGWPHLEMSPPHANPPLSTSPSTRVGYRPKKRTQVPQPRFYHILNNLPEIILPDPGSSLPIEQVETSPLFISGSRDSVDHITI